MEEGPNALQVQGKRGRETKASKRHVVDFPSWMEAWNVFLAIWVQTAPQTAPQLVKYQVITTQLFTSYPAGVCVKYDNTFRQAVARDKANLIPWDQIKEDILVWCTTRLSFQIGRQGPTIKLVEHATITINIRPSNGEKGLSSLLPVVGISAAQFEQ